MAVGFLFSKNAGFPSSTKIEVLDALSETKEATGDIIVEISGEVLKPGVYKLSFGSRIDDLLIISGGLSASSDRGWVDRNINRAAKLSDGQKIYIPKVNDSTAPLRQGFAGQGEGGETGLININTADTKTLDSLSGIGPVYAQNIIEHRPYSETSQLVSKGAIPSYVYEKIKEKISCY